MKNKFFGGLLLISALALSACAPGMTMSSGGGATAGSGGSSASTQSQTPAESQAASGATTAAETHGPEVTDSATGDGLGFSSISG